MRLRMTVAVLLAACTVHSSPVAAENTTPADGIMLQVRMPVTSMSSLLNSAIGVPQFAVGLRRGHIAYGLGLGLSRAGYTDEYSGEGYHHEYTVDATLYQVAATGWYDFWRAPEGQTVGNIVASLQYGRVNYKQKSVTTGAYPYDYTQKGDGNLIGFLVGVGGDHYLGPHFALGLETGVEATFASDLKTENSAGRKTGFSSSVLYGATRATIIF